ncbi:unnamed protein product [Rhodiola kirilowii]
MLTTHQLSNCTNLVELNRIYALVIRTQILELGSKAFHWNNVIRVYSRLEAPVKALFVYIAMSRAGVVPDRYSIPLALKCAIQAFHIILGKEFHGVSVKLNLQCNEFCESGLISLYCNVGEFENARKVFDQNCERKLGSWNAIIGGLAQGGMSSESINMFLRLRRCGLEPDDVTMVSVTSACGSLGDLDLAFQLHKCVYQARMLDRSDMLMLNSLVDMYGKCGRMDLAFMVFAKMDERNVSSWTSMIVGYAMHGHVENALEYFKQMRGSGIRPNHVSFVGVLSACVHGGLVQEGKQYFHMMKTVYNIVPPMNHYGCMVDLLGRAGLFDEAREILNNMPMKPNLVLWGCLMGACEKYGNVELAELASKHLRELEPCNNGCLVVLSNIYASKGMWHEVEKVYVDDIVITGNNSEGIDSLKGFLQTQFNTKDLGRLRYFLGVEVSRSKKGIFLSQRKYVLDLLSETGKIGAKPCSTPMIPNLQLTKSGELFDDPERYRRLVGKLNYLRMTRPDIAYPVSVVSQYMSSPTVDHWKAVEQILGYLKGSPGRGIVYGSHGHENIECFSDADWAGSKEDRRSTSGYGIMFGGNLISWQSKKQKVVSRSSAESEYRAMSTSTCEIVWIHQFLTEIGLKVSVPAKLWCDNQAALHISSNPVFHERTKHIEIDCHFVREKVQLGLITTGYMKTEDQLGDLFTKALNGTRIDYICGKLGMIDIYAPA